MPAQRDDRRLDLCDDGEAQIGFLQSHAAGFEQHHRTDRFAAFAIAQGKFERCGNLAAGNLADAAALKRRLDRGDHGGFAIDRATGDHAAVVRLADDALQRQPRRLDPVEGPKQFAKRVGVEQGAGAFARRQLDKAIMQHERGLRRSHGGCNGAHA
jgi:hypothetical protein